jgi:membrane protease YdiL (CAAX protease family)
MDPDPIEELPASPPPTVELVPEQPLITAPAPAREPFWGYLDLLLVIGVAIGLTVVLLIPLVIFAKVGQPTEHMVALGLGAQAVLYAAIYFALKIDFTARYRKPVWMSLGWRRVPMHPGVYALLGVLLALAVDGLLTLLHTPEVKSPVEGLINSRFTLFVVAVMAVVAAPIFEEAVFRGFLQPLFSRTLGTIAGIIITAALFGVLHWTEYSGVWQYAAAITILGIVFGWIRARTNSLVPSTIMHACHNGVAVVGLIISKYSHLK